MKVSNTHELTLKSSVMTIGAFDGLHRGHQALIRNAVKRANELGVPSVVYTFDPPPRVFFQKKQLLMTVDEKVELLKQYGVDYVVIASFNKVYANRTPLQFLKEIKQYNPLEIIVGSNFTFGKDKQGDIHLLVKHYDVIVHPAIVCEAGKVISSTRIRELLKQSKFEKAESLLGRTRLNLINL